MGTEAHNIRCRLSGIMLKQPCNAACGRCGWNPEVNAGRRRLIRLYAAAGHLRDWGKEDRQREADQDGRDTR